MGPVGKQSFEFGPFRLDATQRLLLRDARPVPLSPKAIETLLMLVEHHGQLVEKADLMRRVWPDTFVEEANLAVNISLLRKTLDGSEDGQSCIETVPRRGYRFVAPVLERPAAEQLPPAAQIPPLQFPARRRRALAVAMAGAVVVAGLVLFLGVKLGGWQFGARARARVPGIRTLAVLPLQNLSGDASQDYLADGLTEALVTDLAEISAPRVRSRTSVMRYKGTKKPLPEIARELNVDGVVEGSITRAGDRVRVTAQLVEASTDRHLWAATYERDFRDILSLEDELAQAITMEISGRVAPRARPPRQVDPAAYELYLKGRYFWNKRSYESLAKGAEYFEQAIQKDPNYAPAFAGLADTLTLLALYGLPLDTLLPRAKAAAEKAVALDSTLVEVHTSLAAVRVIYDWDWPGAGEEFQRAIALNPNNAPARHWHAVLYLAPLGQTQAAVEEMQRALELDPVSPILNTDLGWTCFLARQYERAIHQYQKALELDPNFLQAHFRLSEVYVEQGREAEAFREHQSVARLIGDFTGAEHAAKVFARKGMRGVWRWQMNRLWPWPRDSASIARFNAVTYARLGEKEAALQLLRELAADRDPALLYLKVDPVFDSLHSDPRFQDLLRRMGLSP